MLSTLCGQQIISQTGSFLHLGQLILFMTVLKLFRLFPVRACSVYGTAATQTVFKSWGKVVLIISTELLHAFLFLVSLT